MTSSCKGDLKCMASPHWGPVTRNEAPWDFNIKRNQIKIYGNVSILWSFNNHHLALFLISWPCLRNPYQPLDTTPCLPRSTFFVSMSGLLTPIPWCHREMETLSALLALCEGTLAVIGGFPSLRDSNADRWCFFNVSSNKLLNKHYSGCWSETPRCSSGTM